MSLARFKPGAALSHLIECYWLSESDAAPHRRERALPNGAVTLAINLRDAPIHRYRDDADQVGTAFETGLVGGARSAYGLLDTSRPKSVLGVQFCPGGAATLLGVSGGELADATIDFEALWGRVARDLRERLLAATSAEARVALLDAALMARLRRAPPVHPAVSFALRGLATAPTLARVEAVRAGSGYGAKRFIALFRDAVGMTPKVHARIQRFQAVIRRLARGERVEWARIAADGGFSDQSHLNREFRAFSGVTPGGYRPVAPDRPNHIADDGDDGRTGKKRPIPGRRGRPG